MTEQKGILSSRLRGELSGSGSATRVRRTSGSRETAWPLLRLHPEVAVATVEPVGPPLLPRHDEEDRSPGQDSAEGAAVTPCGVTSGR